MKTGRRKLQDKARRLFRVNDEMRNGTKLKQLLEICDMNLRMEDGVIEITTVNKFSYQRRSKEGTTFSAVLDKAYRQMLKDVKSDIPDPDH